MGFVGVFCLNVIFVVGFEIDFCFQLKLLICTLKFCTQKCLWLIICYGLLFFPLTTI